MFYIDLLIIEIRAHAFHRSFKLYNIDSDDHKWIDIWELMNHPLVEVIDNEDKKFREVYLSIDLITEEWIDPIKLYCRLHY